MQKFFEYKVISSVNTPKYVRQKKDKIINRLNEVSDKICFLMLEIGGSLGTSEEVSLTSNSYEKKFNSILDLMVGFSFLLKDFNEVVEGEVTSLYSELQNKITFLETNRIIEALHTTQLFLIHSKYIIDYATRILLREMDQKVEGCSCNVF